MSSRTCADGHKPHSPVSWRDTAALPRLLRGRRGQLRAGPAIYTVNATGVAPASSAWLTSGSGSFVVIGLWDVAA